MKGKPKHAEFSCQGKHAEILIYEEIDRWWGLGAKDFADDLRSQGDIETISLRINSPGGDVFDGLAIFNTLVRHKAVVTVDIDGMALSIASIIALAGDTVRMADNAMFMVHDPWSFAVGSADEFREQADLMDKIKDSLVSTYMARTDQAEVDISEMMTNETWMSAEEAKEAGFVDEVTTSMKIAASFDRDFKAVPSWARQRMKIEPPIEPTVNKLAKSKQKLALTLAMTE